MSRELDTQNPEISGFSSRLRMRINPKPNGMER